LRNLMDRQSGIVRKAGARIMCEIHRFALRGAPSHQPSSSGPAEVIIFPGVRIERVDALSAGEGVSANGDRQSATKRAIWQDD